jgi:hypothetical protein
MRTALNDKIKQQSTDNLLLNPINIFSIIPFDYDDILPNHRESIDKENKTIYILSDDYEKLLFNLIKIYLTL